MRCALSVCTGSVPPIISEWLVISFVIFKNEAFVRFSNNSSILPLPLADLRLSSLRTRLPQMLRLHQQPATRRPGQLRTLYPHPGLQRLQLLGKRGLRQLRSRVHAEHRRMSGPTTELRRLQRHQHLHPMLQRLRPRPLLALLQFRRHQLQPRFSPPFGLRCKLLPNLLNIQLQKPLPRQQLLPGLQRRLHPHQRHLLLSPIHHPLPQRRLQLQRLLL